MDEKRRHLPGRNETGVIGFYLGLLAAVVVAVLADGLVRAGAAAVIGLFILYFLLGDFFLAVSDERVAKKHPHDNRNSDVGRRVRVLEDFVADNRSSRGSVLLAGETWKARSRDSALYKAGETLVVVRVEGLVLVVAPPDGAGSTA
jgi:membrane protein implicated in regulation of membrane protease activity